MIDVETALRQQLHCHPELSGNEANTATRILEYFRPLSVDETFTGLGGHGLAFAFNGSEPGPTVMLRCELDALPIHEQNELDYCSSVEGVSHKCGHDGHMAILAAVGGRLHKRKPTRGRVVLLFQPAEETGQGAEAVIADDTFRNIRPDLVFALHNLPGFKLGQVVVKPGTICCASRGMIIEFNGRTAHAAQPETGVSPATAMTNLIEQLGELPIQIRSNDRTLVTVVGAQLGRGKAFGTAPGYARVMATLRSDTNETMERLVEQAEGVAKALASENRLDIDVRYEDIFEATVNSDELVELVSRAAGKKPVMHLDQPFRWSEDFGRFTSSAEGVLFGLGAGERTPDLHNPDYDFPDELIHIGARVFANILDELVY